MQAQVVVTETYQIIKTLPLGEKKFIFDLAYIDDRRVCVSVVNTEACNYHRPISSGPAGYIFRYGSYVCYMNVFHYFIFCTDHSVKYLSENYLCSNPTQIPTIFGKAEGGYTPNGMAVCKSGAILIALWNGEVQDRSRGKVLKITLNREKFFEMETDKNRRLFICPTYVTENTNEDICVCDVGAVVVTDIGGMRRFRYEGQSSDPHFDPYGICCDSRCNIIIADMKNDKIHMIDQNGEFLHYIQYDEMKMPRALSIDKNDNLYVGEWNCDVIKVISSQ